MGRGGEGLFGGGFLVVVDERAGMMTKMMILAPHHPDAGEPRIIPVDPAASGRIWSVNLLPVVVVVRQLRWRLRLP